VVVFEPATISGVRNVLILGGAILWAWMTATHWMSRGKSAYVPIASSWLSLSRIGDQRSTCAAGQQVKRMGNAIPPQDALQQRVARIMEFFVAGAYQGK